MQWEPSPHGRQRPRRPSMGAGKVARRSRSPAGHLVGRGERLARVRDLRPACYRRTAWHGLRRNRPRGGVRTIEAASHGATHSGWEEIDGPTSLPVVTKLDEDARFVRAGPCARLGKPVAPRVAGAAAINGSAPAHPR
jgi:hypothetical protein